MKIKISIEKLLHEKTFSYMNERKFWQKRAETFANTIKEKKAWKIRKIENKINVREKRSKNLLWMRRCKRCTKERKRKQRRKKKSVKWDE